MKTPLLIVGAGGHARVVISLARRLTKWELVGLADRTSKSMGEIISGVSIKWTFDDLETEFQRGIRHAALALGDNAERADMYLRLRSAGFEIPSLVHPSSVIESDVTVGTGATVCAGAILCTLSQIGENVLINTGAIIDHETEVGAHAHVGPGARLAGRVKVGPRTFIGCGAVVRDKVNIGAGSIVGAGAVVVGNLPDNVVAYGCPARVQRSLS